MPALWLIGDAHLQNIIPKFLHNKARYPEMAVFEKLEYQFDMDLRMHQVPQAFLGMLNTHDHLPQAVVIQVRTNDIGVATKAQAWARVEDMITDVAAMWEKVKPGSTFKLGLFVSLLPPQLWYPGFHQQKAGREARRSLNSHLGKVAKDVQAVIVPHHVITAEEKWFSDPRCNPTKLSEPGHDILIQDICLALTTHMQFSSIEQQRHVAIAFFHGQAHNTADFSPKKTKQGKKTRRGNRRKHTPTLRWHSV